MMIRSVALVIVTYAFSIEANYSELHTNGTTEYGDRVNGDELIFYAKRISPFYEDNKNTTFSTEILFKAPKDVELITFLLVVRTDVSLKKKSITMIVI